MRLNHVRYPVFFALSFFSCVHLLSSALDRNDDEYEVSYTEKRNKIRDTQFLLSSLSTFFRDKELCDELGILDEQRTQLGDALSDFHRRRQLLQLKLIEARNLAGEGEEVNLDRAEENRYARDYENLLEVLSKIEETLLPHQLDRLNQVATQRELIVKSKHKDVFELPLMLSDQLELSNAERRRLEADVAEIRSEYRRRLRELQIEMNERLVESIPHSKRDEFTEIVGDLRVRGH